MGGAVGALLVIRAIGVEIVLLTGALDVNGALSPSQKSWTFVLWNPWFLLGGIAFCAASNAACVARAHPEAR